MSKKPIQKHTEMHAETETHAEATIAAILTLAITPQNAAGHEAGEIIGRYKEVLQKLRASSGGAFY
jgi:hypothetical protein